jgi:hypothetical protein
VAEGFARLDPSNTGADVPQQRRLRTARTQISHFFLRVKNEDAAMTPQKTAKETKPATVVANDHPTARTGRLKALGGSPSDDWNNVLANQTVQALWLTDEPERSNRQRSAIIAALVGIGPRDELEGMMAAQLVAAHNAAMECYRRAMIPEQSFEGRRENLSQAMSQESSLTQSGHSVRQALTAYIF